MNVSIVIPVYNAAAHLEDVIGAVLAQDYRAGMLEIILLDDGSTDQTEQIIKTFPVTYIHQQNRGPASARNVGWKMAKGEVVCFTDSDCLPPPNWVSQIISVFDHAGKDRGIAAVCGGYDIANPGILIAECIHQDYLNRYKKMGPFVHVFSSHNVAFLRDVLEEVNGFNEQYTSPSGEDNELSYKIFNHNYKICFRNEIKVAHYHPDNLVKYLKKQFRHGVWRMKIFQDLPGFAVKDDYAGFFIIIEPLLAVCIILLGAAWFLSVIVSAFVSSWWAVACLGLIAVNMIGNIKAPREIYKATGEVKYFYLVIINTMRGFARGLGMIRGVFRFWL